jgi:hypothetical protein
MESSNWKNGIMGIVMRPCSMTDEDNDKVMHSSDYSVRANFLQEYNNHIAAMSIVAECAKIFVTNNWEKVTDWSKLNVIVEDGRGGKKHKPVEYFNYEPKPHRHKKGAIESINKIFERLEKEDAKKHNPVTSVTGVVLDPTDGDFSLTINGKEHWWISDDSVIVIANYIEEQLKEIKP